MTPAPGGSSRGSSTALPTCSRCGATFHERDLLALHLGRVHRDEIDPDEQARFDDARARETAWLSRFRSHVAGALGAASVLFLYVGIILSSYVLRANPAFVALPAPGIVIFAVVTYWLVYKHRRDVETREQDA